MRAAALLLGATGCHLVFELEDTTVAPCELEGIQLCLTFDDELADGDTPDLSGQGNDAELVAVLPALRGEQQAAALELDSRITVKNVNTLNFPGPLTIDAFFRWRGTPSSEFVQAVLDNSNQWGIQINTNTGYACAMVFTDGAVALPGVLLGGFTYGTWHHIACVFDPARGVISYFDGVETAIDAQRIGGTLQTTAVGGGNVHAGSFNNNTAKLIGDVDNVRVFDRVLTPDEILATANDD